MPGQVTPLELMAYKMGMFLPAGPFHWGRQGLHQAMEKLMFLWGWACRCGSLVATGEVGSCPTHCGQSQLCSAQGLLLCVQVLRDLQSEVRRACQECVWREKGGNYANLPVLYTTTTTTTSPLPMLSWRHFHRECKTASLVADAEFSKLPLKFYLWSVF